MGVFVFGGNPAFLLVRKYAALKIHDMAVGGQHITNARLGMKLGKPANRNRAVHASEPEADP